ncbi:hypothetical protein EI94DRAFT_1698702 [Lactarius quietus]|nr:hypothetical protein EI94DRAFT_1698702 [Lactarius quietus]
MAMCMGSRRREMKVMSWLVAWPRWLVQDLVAKVVVGMDGRDWGERWSRRWFKSKCEGWREIIRCPNTGGEGEGVGGQSEGTDDEWGSDMAPMDDGGECESKGMGKESCGDDGEADGGTRHGGEDNDVGSRGGGGSIDRILSVKSGSSCEWIGGGMEREGKETEAEMEWASSWVAVAAKMEIQIVEAKATENAMGWAVMVDMSPSQSLKCQAGEGMGAGMGWRIESEWRGDLSSVTWPGSVVCPLRSEGIAWPWGQMQVWVGGWDLTAPGLQYVAGGYEGFFRTLHDNEFVREEVDDKN